MSKLDFMLTFISYKERNSLVTTKATFTLNPPDSSHVVAQNNLNFS